MMSWLMIYSCQETSHPACELMESFIRPRAARNTELEWRFIVNSVEEEDSDYQQVAMQNRISYLIRKQFLEKYSFHLLSFIFHD